VHHLQALAQGHTALGRQCAGVEAGRQLRERRLDRLRVGVGRQREDDVGIRVGLDLLLEHHQRLLERGRILGRARRRRGSGGLDHAAVPQQRRDLGHALRPADHVAVVLALSGG
jgi:hypothetical protein